MNIVKIYKIIRAILAISKVALPVLEDLFKKDLNRDGVIGTQEEPVKE